MARPVGITLANFEEALPKWSPTGENHLYAIVDMGSNGIRFSISDLSPPHTRLLKCIYRERAGISLFDALNSSPPSPTGQLLFPDHVIHKVAATLARFRRIADAYGVPAEHMSVLATEAMRRADNAGTMLEAINAAAENITVCVLAPEVETLFGAVMGSRASFVDISHGGLFLDLGGGSVQMTWVDTRLPSYEIAAALAGESMPFGAARLIRVLEDASAEIQAQETGKLRAGMVNAFAALCEKFPVLREAVANGAGGVDVYLCGGGFRGYGSLLMHTDAVQPYPIPSIGAYTVSGRRFQQTAAMRNISRSFDGKIFGMSKRRRRQFPAIVTVIDAFIETVGNIRTATFCAGSNRDGSLMMKLPTVLRESSPLDVLASIGDGEQPVVDAMLRALKSALPVNASLAETPTIFSLGLGPLFVKQFWSRCGEDDDSNASHALHEAIARDPSTPGLTHLVRAVLALTECARWGSNLGAGDSLLYQGLRGLVDATDGKANFWAEYIGAVAAVMGILIPCWPKNQKEVDESVRFEAAMKCNDKKKDKIELKILVPRSLLSGLDPAELEWRFDDVGKGKGDKKTDKKLSVQVAELI